MPFAVTPGAYIVHVQHKRDDGSTFSTNYDVVAFDDEGMPLVFESQALIDPYRLRGASNWCLESGLAPSTLAEPGWNALFASHQGPGESVVYRYPVVAWRGSWDEYGGSATVIGWDDEERTVPFDTRSYERGISNVELLGFFHPERLPEPDTLDQIVARANDQHFAKRRPRAA